MTVTAAPVERSNSTTQMSWTWLFWGLLLPLIVLAARAVGELSKDYIPFDTQYTYLPMARLILENAEAFFHSEESMRAAPGIAIYMALAGANITTIKMLNAVLALSSLIMMFRISQRIAGNAAAACTAWLLVLSPALAKLSVLPQAEAPAIFLTVLWLWATAACLDTSSPRARVIGAAILGGLALGALTLTRATLMYWIPSVALFSAIAGFIPQRNWLAIPWRRVAAIHFIALACVGAYVAKNAADFDKPTIATGAGAALYFGNLPTTRGQEPPYFGLQHDESSNTLGVDHLSITGDRRLMNAAKTILENRSFTQTAGLYLQSLCDFLFFSKSHLRNYSDRIARIVLTVLALAGL